MAHAQTSESAQQVVIDDHVHGEDHNSHHDDSSKDHHDPSNPAGEHGSELHFTAIGVSPLIAAMPPRICALRSGYCDLQYPAPLLPPDPDPDRA